MAGEPEVVDLRGRPMPAHLKEALAAVERAASGTPVSLLTDQEIVLKAIPTAAQAKGLRMKLAMPEENLWRIGLEQRA
jgi:TusA-related sulfurtransferase